MCLFIFSELSIAEELEFVLLIKLFINGVERFTKLLISFNMGSVFIKFGKSTFGVILDTNIPMFSGIVSVSLLMFILLSSI